MTHCYGFIFFLFFDWDVMVLDFGAGLFGVTWDGQLDMSNFVGTAFQINKRFAFAFMNILFSKWHAHIWQLLYKHSAGLFARSAAISCSYINHSKRPDAQERENQNHTILICIRGQMYIMCDFVPGVTKSIWSKSDDNIDLHWKVI